MRFLILSDIHGSRPILEKVMKFYDNGHYDMLLLLGDLLNYGPRNGVPEGLDAPGVVEILSKYQKDIVAVRGNCDSEVDQMLLPFPIMSTYAIVADGKHRIFLTHGHIVNEGNLPPKGCCEVFFTATHICVASILLKTEALLYATQGRPHSPRVATRQHSPRSKTVSCR